MDRAEARVGEPRGEDLLSYKVDHLPVIDGPVGDWRIEAFYVKEGSRAQVLAGMSRRHVPEGLYAGLFKGEGRGAENLWMSDTPPEVASMLPAIRAFEDPSCRRVLIGGLGLGVLLKAALSQGHVERVDVVELNPEVIELVAPHYPDPRVRVHRGDALEFLPDGGPDGAWDYAYYDVWRDVTAANCADFVRIRGLVGERAHRIEFWHREWSESLLAEAATEGQVPDALEGYRLAMRGVGDR